MQACSSECVGPLHPTIQKPTFQVDALDLSITFDAVTNRFHSFKSLVLTSSFS